MDMRCMFLNESHSSCVPLFHVVDEWFPSALTQWYNVFGHNLSLAKSG